MGVLLVGNRVCRESLLPSNDPRLVESWPPTANSSGHRSAMTKWLGLLLALALPGATLTAANAQASYPTRPIRLILPFPAGGAVDHVARLVTAPIAEDLGRPFVI